MVCPQCNAMVSKRDEVCPLCGAHLNVQEQQPQQAFQQPIQQPVQPPFQQPFQQPVQQSASSPKPQPKKLGAGKIALIVIGILALIGTGLAISSKPETKANADSKGTSSHQIEYEKNTTESTTAFEEENILAEYSNLVLPNSYIDGGTKSVEPSVGLRLRYGPSESYDVITVLPYGTSVDIIGVSSIKGWVYVYCANLKMNGWVSEEYLTDSYYSSNKLSVSYYTNTYTVRVEPSVGLNMRNGPSQSYDVMTLLPYNKVLTVMGKSDYDKNWLYVKTSVDGNDIYGFVHSDYVY